MSETQRTANAQHQAAHRRGVVARLARIEESVAAIAEAVVTLAQRQQNTSEEQRSCR